MRNEGELKGEMLVERERKLQREERWRRIAEARSNVWYGRVKGEGIPGYLKKGWGESRWQRVAWFRLRNEMRGENY